jgi:ATP-binding cassette, subfamily B, bacterial PglK
MRQYLNELISLLGEDKKKLPWLLLLFFSVSLLDVAGLGLIGPYVSVIIEPGLAIGMIEKYASWVEISSDANVILMTMSLLLLLIFFLKTISGIWINYIILKFSLDQRLRLIILLMDNYQNMPYILYLKRNSSEYVHTTLNLVNDYTIGLIQAGMKMISDGIVALVILVVLALTDLRAFFLLFGMLMIFLVVYDMLFRNKIKVFGKKSNTSNIKMIKGIREGLEGLKEVRVLGNEEYFLNQVREGAIKNNKYGIYHTVISSVPRYLIEFILVLFIVLLVMLTLASGASLQQLFPTLAVFGLAAVRLLPTATIISKGVATFRFKRDAVSRLFNDVVSINHNEITTNNRHKEVRKIEPFKMLQLKNVSFRYPSAKYNALNNINLEIKSGDSIGIVGESGSGKTTLVDTMLGLLEVENGEIFFNDKIVKDDLNSWHKNIAYLPQQVFLIDDKLKMNVALGVNEEDIDEELLYESLKKASLVSVVEELPDGIDTFLGERGVRLSGGQRQRIALARALYHKRDILIMDESTSALDNETEKEIIKEIKALKGSITMIVIAHRTSTIEHCDVIYKLNKGSIIDFGSPKEML